MCCSTVLLSVWPYRWLNRTVPKRPSPSSIFATCLREGAAGGELAWDGSRKLPDKPALLLSVSRVCVSELSWQESSCHELSFPCVQQPQPLSRCEMNLTEYLPLAWLQWPPPGLWVMFLSMLSLEWPNETNKGLCDETTTRRHYPGQKRLARMGGGTDFPGAGREAAESDQA